MQVTNCVGFKVNSGSRKAVSGAAISANKRRSVALRRRSVLVEAFKVSVLGAAGGIGQPLSLLLKMSPYVTDLCLYDIANTPGVVADLSHCNTRTKVSGFVGDESLGDSLKDADLVIIPAGVPRKPGMTRDDLFNINAGIVKTLMDGVAEAAPQAIVHIISNPVNSTVAIASEVMKAKGVYDPKKIIGVTSLDVVRSNTFVSELKEKNIQEVDVPVIGGHAGITILPLLSQVYPQMEFTEEEIKALTTRIQEAGTEVVKAKDGAGSATLSMAFAAARMAESTLMGLNNEPTYECAFVASNVSPLPYFASKVKLGPEGIEEIPELPPMTDFEKAGYESLIPELQKSIEKGVNFAKGTAPVSA